ncbi:histidine kinase [Marinifilum flexuosum]|uniref:histidine kinase n=1 Tax=Marinifilum flexuosum TaxID=1117708 RepID=UPI00248FFD86|nr:histidine kinase [Marinifilum flexuosum]
MQFKKIFSFEALISFLLGIIATVLIVILLPPIKKYSITNFEKTKKHPNEIRTYEDCNGDGDSEYVRFIKDFIGRPSVLVEQQGRVKFQWNLTGKFDNNQFFAFGDYDSNSSKEIYVLTHENDSIFLHGTDFESQKRVVNRKFISTFQKHSGRIDYSVYEPQLFDFNNDGYKDFVCSLYCGFSRSTRKIVVVDIKNQKVITSPKAGSSPCYNISFFDIDRDGKIEIFGAVPTMGNCRPHYPYTDIYSWLMVLDDNLQYKYQPKVIGDYPGDVQMTPLSTEKENFTAVFYRHRGEIDSTFLALYDVRGELKKSRKIEYDKTLSALSFTSFPKNNPTIIALMRKNGKVQYFDSLLNPIGEIQSKEFAGRFGWKDIDVDGNKEFIAYGKTRDDIIIYRNDYSNPVEIKIDNDGSVSYLSIYSEVNKANKLILNQDSYMYSFNYSKNWLYTYRYLFLFILLAILSSFFYIMGWGFQYFLKKKYEAEKRITSLQVKAIEQQMSPHFTLNILNSIGNLYENHDKKKAQYYFGKYSKLLRITLISSGEIAIPLQEELNFTQNYLELERLRLNESFSFQFIDNQNVPDVNVPKFLIHTFVENAVKHGLFPLQGIREGRIDLKIKEDVDQLQVTIEDNGVGRRKAKDLSVHSTGRGLSILDEILELYQRFESKKISYRIEDKYTDREDSGTRVIITISNN